MGNLSNKEKLVLSKLAQTIVKELSRSNINVFQAKPTVYVTIGNGKMYVSLADEGKKKFTSVLLQRKRLVS